MGVVADGLPVTVGALELVTEVHALGDGQATGCVVDLQAGSMDWQAKLRAQIRVLLSAAADGPDRDGRRKGVADEMSRVYRHQPIAHHEPQATVGGLERGGQRPKLDRGSRHTVPGIKRVASHPIAWLANHPL